MIRAVIDTSVLIRYLIKPGAAIKELIEELWLNDETEMVSAPELIQDLEEVLRRNDMQALIQPDEGQALLDTIQLKADILPSLGDVPPYTRDPKDDKFIACALAGRATVVITLDKDILSVGELEGLRMVTPTASTASWRQTRS